MNCEKDNKKKSQMERSKFTCKPQDFRHPRTKTINFPFSNHLFSSTNVIFHDDTYSGHLKEARDVLRDPVRRQNEWNRLFPAANFQSPDSLFFQISATPEDLSHELSPQSFRINPAIFSEDPKTNLEVTIPRSRHSVFHIKLSRT